MNDRNGAAADRFDGDDDISDRVSPTGAKVYAGARAAGKQPPDCPNMGGRKIADMDIISDRRAIVGVVIGAKYLNCRIDALRSGDHQGNNMGLRRMGFTEPAI